MELSAVHGDGDVGKQPVLQGEVHNALDHAAGVGAVGEGVPQEVVLLSHRAPDTEAPLLIYIHLWYCLPDKVTTYHTQQLNPKTLTY